MAQEMTNDDLARLIQTEFQRVDHRLGNVEATLEAVDARLTGLNEKVETLDARVQVLDDKVTRIDLRSAHQADASYERTGRLEKRVERVEGHLGLEPVPKAL